MKSAKVSVLDEFLELEQRILDRLRELAPAIAEYEELQALARRLGMDAHRDSPSEVPGAGEKSDGSPTTARPAATGHLGGTRATGAQRRERVLALIAEHPGITVSQLSHEMSVDPPPLYRVVRKLRADGLIDKRGKSLFLV